MEVCELHHLNAQALERVERKLEEQDKERDIIAEKLAKVQTAIDNGLRAEIRGVAQTVGELKDGFKNIADMSQEFKDFRWFRDFASDFRNKLFANTLKAVLVGMILLLVSHFGSKLVYLVVEKAIK